MADSDNNSTESVEAENRTTASVHSADNVGPSISSNFIENAAADATSTTGGASNSDSSAATKQTTSSTSGRVTQQHYVSGILDDVLEEKRAAADDKHSYKHPMILDVVLAIGLLVAMGGFTIGLMNIYITHQAEQSIMQRNYRAAITVLKGAPLAGFFTMPGSDPSDLLNQALYLDAMERLDANGEDETALKDLEKISPGSRYFDISQEILKDHFKPSDRQLEGKAEHTATPAEAVPPKKPILPPAETDATP